MIAAPHRSYKTSYDHSTPLGSSPYRSSHFLTAGAASRCFQNGMGMDGVTSANVYAINELCVARTSVLISGEHSPPQLFLCFYYTNDGLHAAWRRLNPAAQHSSRLQATTSSYASRSSQLYDTVCT